MVISPEEFKAKLVELAQQKRMYYGEVTWGDQRNPPKIEILSFGIVEIDEPFVSVFYRINDFVTYCDTLPNPVYDPDYWTRMVRHAGDIAKAMATFENNAIIKNMGAKGLENPKFVDKSKLTILDEERIDL